MAFFSNLLKALWKPFGEAWKTATTNENYLGSWLSQATGSSLTGAQREANKFSAEQAELAFQRELEASNTQYQRRVEDLQAAGINPMYAAGQSVSLPSASNASSVSPSSSGFNPLDIFSMMNNIRLTRAQVADLNASKNLKNAEAANRNADTALKQSQTFGQDIQNRINEATEQVQIEAKSLNNDLIRENMDKIRKEAADLVESAKKKSEEATTEIAKRANFAASTALQYASAWEIKELLSYKKTMLTAQSQQAKYSAALSGIQYIYNKGLITGGYIDSLCEKVAAEAGIKISEDDIKALSAALRTGDYSRVKTMDFFSQIASSEGWIQFFTVFLDNFNPLAGLFGVSIGQ